MQASGFPATHARLKNSFTHMTTETTQEPTASAQLLARDKAAVSNAVGRYNEIVFARGEGSYVYDVDGKRYIDLAAGIATNAVGHCHPRVVEAIVDQAKTLLHAGTPVIAGEKWIATKWLRQGPYQR